MSLKSYFEFLLEQEIHQDEAERKNYLGVLNIQEGNRLIDHIAAMNESTYSEFSMLTEQEKYDVDNVIWAGLFEYAMCDEPDKLDEGFFGDLISGIYNMGKKALNFTLGVLQNIGGFFSGVMKYIKDFFAAVIKKASSLAGGLWSKVKGKAEETAMKKVKKIDPEEAKQDLANLKESIEWLTGSAVGKMLEDGEQEGAKAIKQAAGEEKEEAKEIAMKVKKELQESKALLYKSGLAKAINEIRSNPDFDMAEFVEIVVELNKGISESDDPTQELADKKKSWWQRIKKAASISNIISLVCSGVVLLFEKIVKYLTAGSLGAASKVQKFFGGPGAFEYLAIGTICGVIAGLIVELLADFADFGHGILHDIAHALHATNPMHYLKEAAAEYIVPGAKTVLTCISYGIIIYIGTTHVVHAIKELKGEKH
jgi:hypothetical protein